MRYFIISILILYLSACTESGSKSSETNPSSNSGSKTSGTSNLLFTIHQERDVYDQSDYGEPPQFAIWLEDKTSGAVKTVFITNNTGTGNFEGKAECPVALPAWIGAFRKEFNRNDFPTKRNPVIDAVTGATPKEPDFSAKIAVPSGSDWNYYIEVNVSGDYTSAFPALREDGEIDNQGNGQPSIIYKGEITASPGNKSTPKLIGRTEQLYFSPKINPDLKRYWECERCF